MAATASQLPTLMTPEQFCELTGIRPQTQAVWRSTGRHALPFIRVGRLIRYRADDVMAWLESRTERPTEMSQ